MDKRICDHAAAIYARDVKKASEKHAQQFRDIHAEINRLGFQIRDGIAQGMIIAADASFVGERMRIRLESLREAFKDAGLQPSTEDFSQIWESIEEVYSTCLAQDRANPSRLRGNTLDRDIEPAAARHHDDVLAEFNVWRSRIGLVGVGASFTELDQVKSGEVRRVGNIFINNLGGNVALGNVNASGQTVIVAGDRRVLDAALSKVGLDHADLGELTEAIEMDGGRKPGSRVTEWIKAKASKVVTGGIKVSVSIGQQLLTEFLMQHYGLKK
jgi:hypothetical protein